MFKHVIRIKIRKHERYTGYLFDDPDDENDLDHDDNLHKIQKKTISTGVEYLDYEPNVIDKHEIEQLSKCFPNITRITISAENVLETKINLKSLEKLNEI